MWHLCSSMTRRRVCLAFLLPRRAESTDEYVARDNDDGAIGSDYHALVAISRVHSPGAGTSKKCPPVASCSFALVGCCKQRRML